MKKIITLVLMMFIMINTTSYAYSDITDESLKSKIEILSEYNIINGYEDGTFRPHNQITRSEFCKMIICTTMNEATEIFEQTFKDVEDGFWAESYIYSAKKLGIVNGTTEKTFEPHANITNEQAIKMIVCALGYGEKAVELGGYPNGYLQVAESLGIINLDTFDGKKVSTRKEIAEMVYNALGVDFYFITLNDAGEIEKSKAESTLREFHEFLKSEPEIDKEFVQEEGNSVG